MPDPITVIAVDPCAFFLECIGLSRDRDIQLVATGCSGDALEALVERHRSCVALVDVVTPQRTGDPRHEAPPFPILATIWRLRRRFPETRVIPLSQEGSGALLSRAARADRDGRRGTGAGPRPDPSRLDGPRLTCSGSGLQISWNWLDCGN